MPKQPSAKTKRQHLPAPGGIHDHFATVVSVPDGAGLESLRGPAKAGVKNVILSAEQQHVYNLVVHQAQSIFFTGSAGTGKSLLLRAIIAGLRRRYKDVAGGVAVLSTTGMAASNIGGQTVHSWGGIHPVNGKVSYNLQRMSESVRTRWINAHVMLIDEISMMDKDLFELVVSLAVRVRPVTEKPAGGLQIVVTGDFFQLPPVCKNKPLTFAFESPIWNQVFAHTITLTQVFRQKDTAFIDLLNQLREGAMTPAAVDKLKALSRPLSMAKDALPPTELFPLRDDVAKANKDRLDKLRTPAHEFTADDSYTKNIDADQRVVADAGLRDLVAPKEIVLKSGAPVMLIANVDDSLGLVNGCVGRIVGFYKKNGSGVAQEIPRTPDGALMLNDQDHLAGPRFPYVSFSTSRGNVKVLVTREEFKIEDNLGKCVARRHQVPLILAWAISIHKSQGQTLQRVKVDLQRVFAHGHSYVALSRAASMDGIQVIGFRHNKVLANSKVIAWNKTLTKVSGTANATTALQEQASAPAAAPVQSTPSHPTTPLEPPTQPRPGDALLQTLGSSPVVYYEDLHPPPAPKVEKPETPEKPKKPKKPSPAKPAARKSNQPSLGSVWAVVRPTAQQNVDIPVSDDVQAEDWCMGVDMPQTAGALEGDRRLPTTPTPSEWSPSPPYR